MQAEISTYLMKEKHSANLKSVERLFSSWKTGSETPEILLTLLRRQSTDFGVFHPHPYHSWWVYVIGGVSSIKDARTPSTSLKGYKLLRP